MKPGFIRPVHPAAFLPRTVADQTVNALTRTARNWIQNIQNLSEELHRSALSALFDFMISGLYAQRLYSAQSSTITGAAFIHGQHAVFPYVWMCPLCVAAGVEPAHAYLPGSELRSGKRYPGKQMANRPAGRMIGDFGALAMRIIVNELVGNAAFISAGGGHRGEFDLVISNASQLLLCEIKASPLVAFPLIASLESVATNHIWKESPTNLSQWGMYVGAGIPHPFTVPLSDPAGEAWPLDDMSKVAQDIELVTALTSAWHRHLVGYRLFNLESGSTRWHRFGCGNIETRQGATAVQLRVDNTKALPGIDRTDDIKKGIAQVMLFGRLKRGCRVRAIKTVLLGNLFAETHHEHYIRPLADVELVWPGQDPVFLFDAIIAFSRNIINDDAVHELFGLPNTPYKTDRIDNASILEGLAEEDD